MKKIISFFLILLIAIVFYSKMPIDGALAESEDTLKLPIVMYHHISENSGILGDYIVSPNQFEKDLEYLQDSGYETVTLDQLIRWHGGYEELPEKPMMITFDDAHESTAIYARPLLEKYGFTAVLAVIGVVAEQFSELDEHLEYSYMSWDAVKALSESGVFEIQSHTWNMHKFGERKGCRKKDTESTEDYARVLKEDLEKFKAECRRLGITTSRGIAFPFGKYSDETLSIVRELGYLAGFTCNENINYLSRESGNLFELGRFNRAHGMSSNEFFSKWD